MPVTVVDPGFSRGGEANPGGGQHTILPNFPQNCMKLKEFGPGGARPSRPLRSANASLNSLETSTYDFAKISQKLHENERIWTGRGASPAVY